MSDDNLLLCCVFFSPSDFCELTPDPKTVSRNLKLSDNNRKMTHVEEYQPHPNHPDRFDSWVQLLCRTGLTGRCYWQVEWRGWVYISVAYRGIGRKGNFDDSRFGRNDQSWSLKCSDDAGYSVWHNNRKTVLPHSSSSSSSSSGRVAVYVDCPAGTLSFYRVSDSLIHLHTFNTTFTEPLYPGFGFLSPGSLVSLCSDSVIKAESDCWLKTDDITLHSARSDDTEWMIEFQMSEVFDSQTCSCPIHFNRVRI